MSLNMLYEFLIKNQEEILQMTEQKAVDLAGIRESSTKLRQGLPIFFKQLISVLKLEQNIPPQSTKENPTQMAAAAANNDEPGIVAASGHLDEVAMAKSGGVHGTELLRLGYTLSHVVHAYGAMCQAITELATLKKIHITPNEFHDLNRCLDIAIAGAVTEFQIHQTSHEKNREVEHLGFLAHELRNALSSVNVSIQLIKRGTVGFGGNTGKILDKSLKRIDDLISRSLTEVRLKVDPKVYNESAYLIQIVNQILTTAEVDASSRDQRIEVEVDGELMIEADLQLFYSALSNLVQNAIKYSHRGSKIQIRGSMVTESIVIEVEDQCGGLLSEASTTSLFNSFEQQNSDRSGLGLGLSIAKRAILLNQGTICAENIPGKGCIFRITLPKKASELASKY